MSIATESSSSLVSWPEGLLRGMREAALIIAFVVLAAAATHFLHPRAPQWFVKHEPLAADEVTLEIIQQKWGGEVIWIDARPRQAYAAAHIPDALLLNEQETDALMFEHMEKLQSNTKPLIIYCDGHACQASRKIASYLRKRLPQSEIYVLHGGWKSWLERH
jgi:rhodanese-related sulfurtransferase